MARGRDGYFLYNVNDQYVGKSIERYGEFSWFESHLFEQICRPGGIVVEVGANIGAHTVGLARKVGPTGSVYAFEPQRLPFQTLCANVSLNSLANVECHWAALGERAGAIRVPEADPNANANFGGVSLAGGAPGRQVPCMTLDSLIALPRLDLVKIDVEGMEADVIRGGRAAIGKFKPFLYVENDRVDLSEALMRLIDSLGYRMYWHMPALFNPANFYAESDNIFSNIASFNLLCVHRDTGTELQGFDEVSDFSVHPLKT